MDMNVPAKPRMPPIENFADTGPVGRSQPLLYNTRRPHQALGGQAPMAVWRAGTSGILDARAVDMTLRLDNAAALPTCPQPQQQQALVD